MELVKEFIFLGSNVNTDESCNNEIKRRLLMSRKTMVILQKLNRSKDFNMATKIRIIRRMVFPVTTYGYENWTMKQEERKEVDAFERCCWRMLLPVSWTGKNEPVCFRGNKNRLLTGIFNGQIKAIIPGTHDSTK